eukprot:2552281-Alexandrium_andersonii.AAC.1
MLPSPSRAPLDSMRLSAAAQDTPVNLRSCVEPSKAALWIPHELSLWLSVALWGSFRAKLPQARAPRHATLPLRI